MKHYLKTWPKFFQVSWVGDKPWELRIDDRNYQERDEIVLQEWDPDMKDIQLESDRYTGREIEGFIRFLLRGPAFGLAEGHCIFTIQETSRREG